VTTSTLPYAARAAGLVGSVIDSSTSLLHKQTHDVVRLAMGSPAAEAVPSEVLAGIAAIELSAPDAYDYAATEGDPPLHAALLEMLRGTSDETTADRLTITAGGMQGLDLFCKIFVDPGDLVTVESPTYTNGSATALSYGATLLEIPVDDDGMDIDELERLVAEAGRKPKAIYAIPTFQNPSGVTMSLERRLRLLELARQWGSMVIDDDPYGLLRFAGESLPTLRELGYPRLIAREWFGFFAPRGTPVDAVEGLSEDLRAAAATPELVASLRDSGLRTLSGTPAEMAEQIARDRAYWREAAPRAEIRVN